MRPASVAAPVLVTVAYRQEPCCVPLRQTSLEVLPSRASVERSPLRGAPSQVGMACMVPAQPMQAGPILHTPRVPQATWRMVRSGSQSRAMERSSSGALAAERISMPTAAASPQRSRCVQTMQPSRSWQPCAASPRPWPNKEQQEQIERLTRQVEELREQQKRHQEWAQIPAAALGTELTPAKPQEVHVERVLNDIPTACRNALRSPQCEVSLASPRQSITGSACKLRDAMGTFGLPAPPTPPPTPPQPSEEEGPTSLTPQQCSARSARSGPPHRSPQRSQRSPSPPGTSPEQPRSFVLQQPKGLSNVARLSATRSEDARGSPGLQSAESIPPSPPKLAEKCSTRLRLADRLDLANAADSSCSGETEYHPQPWSLPVADANRAPGTSTNSTTSSARSLKLSCKDSLDGTTAAPASVGEAPNRASQLVQHVAAQVTAKELAELRSFRNPPAVVCQVLEAVAVILGVPDARWSSMRKLLDNNLLTRLSVLNPLELTQSQQSRLQMLLQVPTFTDGSLLERCPAVASLARWCSVVGSTLNGEDKVDLGGLIVEPDLWQLNDVQLAKVEDLTVMRHGVGCVTFHGITDCRELVYCLPDVVVLNPGEVVIYPNQKVKPPVGSGLNKASTIKLYGCHPKSQIFKDERAREKYRIRVKAMTEEKGAEFIDYDCDQGVWQFRVSHF